MILQSKSELEALVRTGTPPAPRPLPVLPCKRGGTDADIIERCPTCAGGGRHVRECEVHGRCTHEPVNPAVMDCSRCRREGLGYAPDVPPRPLGAKPVAVAAHRVAWWDESAIAPGESGRRFNPSLIRHRGRLLLAYRDGWAGSEVHIQPLTETFAPDGPSVRLELHHERASYGREDPRLFTFGGRLHVSYIGVESSWGWTRTNQMYARLGDDLRTEAVYAPDFGGRNTWEKNWSFFEHESQLYAVYAIGGQRVLRIDGDAATAVHQTHGVTPWAGGEPRGGAAPVRVGSEWWSFFHDRLVNEDGMRVYRAGLYTFGTEPPFAPLRWVPAPILTADPDTRGDNYAAVCFPGGAARDGDRWLLACGTHDRWSEVWSIAHADLERALVPVRPA